MDTWNEHHGSQTPFSSVVKHMDPTCTAALTHPTVVGTHQKYSEWCTPYVFLKCLVLGDEIKVHGENRIRNLSNGKTIGQAVYGL